MITRYLGVTINLKSVLAAPNTYFIVTGIVPFNKDKYTLGNGSVIEFRGGSFKGTAGSLLNLNGGQIIAGPYPIFSRMEVMGFSNSRVFAEWFKDSSDTEPHIYINKALRSAKGCPVVLALKEYKLKGTIVFPRSSASTLISEGNLSIDIEGGSDEWNNDPVAIDINVSNVRLDIKYITGVIKNKVMKNENGKNIYEEDSFAGTGIRISGEVFHVSINVNAIRDMRRGIEILPGRSNTYANMQFLNIKFQSITAGYGIYIDIFAKGNPEQNWVARSSIHGGRLIGWRGIYMACDPAGKFNKISHISEMRFTNIGFEELTSTPIHLCNATRLMFEYIRMAESLPVEGKWIYLKNVSRVSFTVNGDLDAEKYETRGICDHIMIKGTVLLRRPWTQSLFDTLLLGSAVVKGQDDEELIQHKAATYSVSPFQMTNVISQAGILQQALPTVLSPVAGRFGGLKVLPRMFQFKINSATTIDLTGLQDYASCMYYFTLENRAVLTLLSSVDYKFPRYVTDINVTNPQPSLKLSEEGLYQLTWVTYQVEDEDDGVTVKNSEWAAYIKKIATN